MPSLAHYMAQYDHEHGSAANKMLHAAGITLILAGTILLLFMKWIWGAGFFLGGWALLFLGHRLEGNRPAFFQGLEYLLVGPICWQRKFGRFSQEASAGRLRRTAREAQAGSKPSGSQFARVKSN